MTLAEVAGYLHLAERTVLRMAQRGEIPAAKVANQWRFMRSLVRDWLAAKMQMPALRAGPSDCDDGPLALGEILRPELMSLGLRPGPKPVILRQLVAPLVEAGFARYPSRLLAGLMEREEMMTTGIGNGVAVPHLRRPVPGMFSTPAVAVGTCPQGTDFAAIDGQPVHTFFLICATREDIHLELMARVSWLSRQGIAEELKDARSAQEAATIILQAVEMAGRGRP
ncbi:MAG: hypothetical protein B1H04_05555 [Planctomycetales bacterium 4484_123]|nr:MAG: hypothetical protein B1H04_05555 [Planctomycetales bacterium 4484_123]